MPDLQVKFLFWVPAEWRQRLKVAAAQKGVTMRQYIIDAVNAAMKAPPKPPDVNGNRRYVPYKPKDPGGEPPP